MIDQTDLLIYEQKGLIKSSSRDGYTVWCYTQRCVVENAWDEVTMACRGLVFADDGTLVSRPFKKFFNWDQPGAVIEQGPFLAYDKMDGTLIVVGEYEGEAVVSTKGSFDTWHSEAARGLLLGFVPPKGYTCMFELIHPDNRIVVDYGDYTGLVFLGALENETGADYLLPEDAAEEFGWHGDVVVRRSFNFNSMTNTIQNPEAGEGREGFVVVWPKEGASSNRVKLKFAMYVALHGIYTGLTNRRVWEHIVNGTMDDLYEVAPDELHDAIRETEREIRAKVEDYVNTAHLEAVQAAFLHPDRKSVAEYFAAHSVDRTLAFLAYDEKWDRLLQKATDKARPEVSQFVGKAGLN
ncbi:MAG: hypothetical protein E6Q97_34350 [Desulfurellales bacterium]|nr:MAG: hypothetical protein E6Q97_34350 [Desulfurellales bacterium]